MDNITVLLPCLGVPFAVLAGATLWFWQQKQKADRALQRAQADLDRSLHIRKQADVMLAEFLSVASHELRTPVTALKMRLELSKRFLGQPSDPAKLHERLDSTVTKCLEQVSRLYILLDSLLDIARLESGQLECAFSATDVAELIRTAVDSLSDQFHEAKCEVQVEGDAQVFATCDRSRIEQVFVNLLTNAIKYGNSKPVRVTIVKQRKTVRISIQDQGIGISDELKDVIFKRFGRAKTAKAVDGLGLGLYISNQIVLLHFGTLIVESEPGQGSTFHVTLPLEIPSQSAAQS